MQASLPSLALLVLTTTLAPAGLAQDLLVSSRFTDEILRYDASSGAFLGVFASGGGLDNPVGLSFGPDGHLYVSSGDTNEILRYDGTTGAFLDVFASGGGLNGPRNLNFGPDGNLYVASGSNSRILRYDGNNGAFIDLFAQSPGLRGPTSLSFGPDGDLYVAGVLSNRIHRFHGRTGALIGVFADTQLSGPHDLGFGPDGNLYVSNAFTGNIVRFDGKSGQFLDEFIRDPNLNFALGLSWGLDGRLYVANQGQDEIRRYDAETGAFLDSFVTAGSGGLDAPLFQVFLPDAGGFEIQAVHPGLAAALNRIELKGMTAGARHLLAFDRRRGSSPFPTCPGLRLELRHPKLVAKWAADESGRALLFADIPGKLRARRLWLQAVDLGACRSSRLFTQLFQ